MSQIKRNDFLEVIFAFQKSTLLIVMVFFANWLVFPSSLFCQKIYSNRIQEGLLYLNITDSIYELTLFNSDTSEVLSFSKGDYKVDSDSIKLNSFPELDSYVVEPYFLFQGGFCKDTLNFIVIYDKEIVSNSVSIKFNSNGRNYSYSSSDGLLIRLPKDSIQGVEKIVFFISEDSELSMLWSDEIQKIDNVFFVYVNSQSFDWSPFYLRTRLQAFEKYFEFRGIVEIKNYTFHSCYYSESEVIIPDFKPPGQFKRKRDVVLKRIK
jgi:hypothetical protein